MYSANTLIKHVTYLQNRNLAQITKFRSQTSQPKYVEYQLTLMSITSINDLDTSKLDEKPYFIKDEKKNYYVWGYKDEICQWQLAAVSDHFNISAWRDNAQLTISPLGKTADTFNTLKKYHTPYPKGITLEQKLLDHLRTIQSLDPIENGINLKIKKFINIIINHKRETKIEKKIKDEPEIKNENKINHEPEIKNENKINQEPEIKNENKINHEPEIKEEKELDQKKYILNDESINVSKSLLYNLFKMLGSLSPFHSSFFSVCQAIKELIQFFESQCCNENDHKPLDSNTMNISYSVIWCASAMHGLINYLNNPTFVKDTDWLEDYKQYKQRAHLENQNLNRKQYWADYETALLSYCYLQEADILINSDKTQEGEVKLAHAEKKARKSLDIYLKKVEEHNSETTTVAPRSNEYYSNFGMRYDCAALYIYHELYNQYFKLNLQKKAVLSIDATLNAFEKVKEHYLKFKVALQQCNSAIQGNKTATGVKYRLLKKLDAKHAAKSGGTTTTAAKNRDWLDLLNELSEEVDSYISVQSTRFNEWDKRIKTFEKKFATTENAKKLMSNYNEIQAILTSIQLPNNFLTVNLNEANSTIHLNFSETSMAEDKKLLYSCFLKNRVSPGFKYKINMDPTSKQITAISLSDAANLNTDIFKTTLNEYIIQVKEKTKTASLSSQPETTLYKSIIKIEPEKPENSSPLDNVVRMKVESEIKQATSEMNNEPDIAMLVANLNKEASEKRTKDRTPNLYQNNFQNAILLFNERKDRDDEKLKKRSEQFQNLLLQQENEKKEKLEKSYLKKQGSNTIYDDTKLLIAFQIIEDLNNSEYIDDDKQHIIFGCILHVILELNYRIRQSNSHYNFNQNQKAELKQIVRGIRNLFVHYCLDYDLSHLTNITKCILPLKVLFHKNFYEKNSEIANLPYDVLKKNLQNLEQIIRPVAIERTVSPENDLKLLDKMHDLLNNFINYDEKHHQQSQSDMQFFLCLGMIIKIQECTTFFSPSFNEIYGVELDQFRIYRNQLAHNHREENSRISNIESLHDDYTIYQWNKIIEIKNNQAPILLKKIIDVKFELQNQYCDNRMVNK